jgi:NAD dependent epimerase/dehydratase family enzyme
VRVVITGGSGQVGQILARHFVAQGVSPVVVSRRAGRQVVPRRLLESGFTFQFPGWSAAAADLVKRRRARAS